MMQYLFDGKVEDFKLKLYDEQSFREHIKSLNGKPICLTLARGGKRSNQQNRYLWGVVYAMLSEHIGEQDVELIHEYCKKRFLPKRILSIASKESGEIVDEEEVSGTTAKLSTIEFSEYIEKIQIWASTHLNLSIPDPNEH